MKALLTKCLMKLGPVRQRWLILVIVFAAAWIAMICFSSGAPPAIERQRAPKTTRHIFTDRAGQETALDNLSAEIRAIKEKNKALQEKLAAVLVLQEQQQKRKDALNADVIEKIQQLETQLAIKEAQEITTQNQPTQSQPNNFGVDNSVTFYPKKSTIFTVSQQKVAANTATSSTNVIKKQQPSLTAGSILSGILINGLDAPTSNAARREPIPVLVRLKKEAILPNLRRSDIKECFLMLSGYGDMSAERAYLRGECISCVCNNGDVIEEPIDCYAVGEDGKVGIRGRVVSKQGQAIANSMLAGFFGGAAGMFDVKQIPTLSLNTGASVFQDVLSKKALKGAAAQGASSALDKVSKFYLDLAENLFPVIEIDAGRQVDVILKKGTRF